MLSRKIEVSWKSQANVISVARVLVKANNRDNILNDIITKINENKLNINSVSTKITPDREIGLIIMLNISSAQELQKIIKEIRKIDSVFEVRRIQ